MKPTPVLIAALIAVLFAAAAAANAQTTAPPIAQTPATAVKIAVLDSGAFPDPKTGVKRLIAASSQIDNELAQIRQDIINKNTRLQTLSQKANTAAGLTPAEADEADTLKREIQRRQEDGQKKLESLTRTRLGPILADLSNALQAYAKQRGFDLVLDLAKFQDSILIVNKGIDITDAFILDYNSRNPATAAPAATTTTPPKTP